MIKKFLNENNLRSVIFDIISEIKDPEFNKTLEDLNIVSFEDITVRCKITSRSR